MTICQFVSFTLILIELKLNEITTQNHSGLRQKPFESALHNLILSYKQSL